MAPVPSCAAELPTLFQAVLLGVPAAGGQGWVAGAEAPPFCGRCPPATWLLLITLGTAAHTPQGPAHSPPRPAAPAGTAPPRAGPLQERWTGGAPAACTVGCMVAGSVGWSCPPQMSWTSLWPALPLSPAALSPGGLALTSTPDRPQLPSPRAPSCPCTEERPSQRAPGSQVRVGPTWGRVGDPGVSEAGDPVVDARHSGVSPARLPRRPRAEGGGQGAGRCLRPAP